MGNGQFKPDCFAVMDDEEQINLSTPNNREKSTESEESVVPELEPKIKSYSYDAREDHELSHSKSFSRSKSKSISRSKSKSKSRSRAHSKSKSKSKLKRKSTAGGCSNCGHQKEETCFGSLDSSDDDEYADGGYYKHNVKILFLDVDGVLNNDITPWDEFNNGIDDKLLKYLKLIVLKTKCKIVLSTTWRLHSKTRSILLHTLKSRIDLNVDDIVIGSTPSIKSKNRTYEIAKFIHQNEKRFNVISWVAIDDWPLHKYKNDEFDNYTFINGHFVQTDKHKGISPQNAIKCINILNQNDYKINPYQYQYKYYQ